MPPFLNFIGKPAPAKGLNPNNFIITANLHHHLFEDELFQLEKLKDIPPLALNTNNPLLLYPGSGSDILYPLFFLEHLINNLKQVTLVFIDQNYHLRMIKSILEDLGLSFSEENNFLNFYWKNLLVKLEFIVGNIFSLELPAFDIYFERKFAIFKEYHELYEANIFNNLNVGGIIISDYGFKKCKLEQIGCNKELSAYGEMIVGRKIT